jgi:hypothetical protein
MFILYRTLAVPVKRAPNREGKAPLSTAPLGYCVDAMLADAKKIEIHAQYKMNQKQFIKDLIRFIGAEGLAENLVNIKIDRPEDDKNGGQLINITIDGYICVSASTDDPSWIVYSINVFEGEAFETTRNNVHAVGFVRRFCALLRE